MGKITALTVLLAVVFAMGLLRLKQEVAELEDSLIAYEKNIEANRQAVRVLKAEWSHLNDPRRLRRLAQRHIDLRPPQASQFVTWDAIPKTPLVPPTISDAPPTAEGPR